MMHILRKEVKQNMTGTNDTRSQDNLDPQTRSRIGQAGGEARQEQGTDYSEIGQKGGQATQQSGNAHELTNEEQSEGGSK